MSNCTFGLYLWFIQHQERSYKIEVRKYIKRLPTIIKTWKGEEQEESKISREIYSKAGYYGACEYLSFELSSQKILYSFDPLQVREQM